MNKQELVAKVAEETQQTKKLADEIITTTFTTIINALKAGDFISIPGFGQFDVKTTAKRKGRNPATGEKITIPPGKKISFKKFKTLKELFK